MSTMLDKWHDRYHADAPDYANCPYCMDELQSVETLPLPTVAIDMEVEWGEWLEATFDPDANPIDRIEDMEV